MKAGPTSETPLVSVIIPCYNHAVYLPEAVASVQQQDYPAIEVVIVDDGSTDNTKSVGQSLLGVKYVYQKNAGLSAARNTGIRESNGAFLIFLDADDVLIPGAIRTNVEYHLHHPGIAFVSGGHDKVFTQTGKVVQERAEVTKDHYLRLLKGNYIGMIATVMFRRFVFEEFQFNTKLPVCEDYDLYLKIARKYPVQHHTHNMAEYHLHGTNMSHNIPVMMRVVQQVLHQQQQHLRSPEEHAALAEGKQILKRMYFKELYESLWQPTNRSKTPLLFYLLRHRPRTLIKYFLRKAGL